MPPNPNPPTPLQVQVGYGPALPDAGSSLVLGLAGLLRLGRGAVLVLVTHAKRVGRRGGAGRGGGGAGVGRRRRRWSMC